MRETHHPSRRPRPPHVPQDAGFVEVADRCWVARHAWYDVNVCVVAGARGLLVVDTHASARAAAALLEQVRGLPGDVVGTVNTHEHFDHTFGNGTFAEAFPGLVGYAHETAAEQTVPAGERIKALYAAGPPDPPGAPDPHRDEVLATDIVPATETFSSVHVVDLGDRVVELIHPGRGHTGGDAVVRVGDADLLFAGDLVEESSLRGGVPGFGADSFPLEWPATLDLVVGMLSADSLVVPGHGTPVDRGFVEDQRSAVGVVAETIRDLAGRGVPVDQALEAAEWPYPREELADAVRRGYAQLPPAARSLPLL